MRQTTVKGRVVYNRPRHFFSVKDLARVSRSVPPPRDLSEALYALGTIGGILLDLTQAVYYVIGVQLDARFFLTKWKSIMIQGLNAIAVLPLYDGEREKIFQVISILDSI